MASKSESYDILLNRIIDMQSAITGWRKGLAFESEKDLINELDRQIVEALKSDLQVQEGI